MKQFLKKLLKGSAVAFGLWMLVGPMSAKAYNNTMHVVDATDTTITIDWSMAADDQFEEQKADGNTSYKWDYFKVGYAANPCDRNKIKHNISVNTKLRQYTIKGLKPDTEYTIEVDWRISHSGPKGTGTTVHNFQVLDAATTGGSNETAKFVGSTGTTAAVDISEALRNIECECREKNHKPSMYTISVGYADQAAGTEAALMKAKEIAGKKYYKLGNKQGIYNMRGLSPNHTYTFVAAVWLSANNADTGNYKKFFKYVQLSDIKTKDTDDSAIYNSVEPVTKFDSRKDSDAAGRYLSSSYDSYGVTLATTVTADSITLDWSKQKQADRKIKAAKDEKKLCFAIVEDEQYDADADRQKYGPSNNCGPNVRKAAKKADAHQFQADVSTKSFTFSGLKPATSYTVIMKCSWENKTGKSEKIYPYLTHICTEGAKTDSEIDSHVKKDKVIAYMYDGVVKHQGSEAHLDWTNAIKNYCGQTVLSEYCARPGIDCVTEIGYAKLPADLKNSSAVKASYQAAEKMLKNTDYNALAVNYPYSNTRIYNLDPGAKYVFAVRFTTYWYLCGVRHSFTDTFYIDETGINYYKANKTGASYGGSSSGSGESGSGNSGENGSGDDISSPDDQQNEENPSEEKRDGRTNDSNTAPGSNSKSGRQVNSGKANNLAQITCSSEKVSYKKLKKKAQTVTIKIDNSKGKISVKDISSKKNRNVASISIKGRKVILKFKKGTSKGVYKFKVTVGAKDGIKKTTETFKIKVS
ncbi:fibronectin type III domain-containing protein [Butyrivibrio sp. WCD3002]|uniref:fibronectin type III domain-containing protein n=1 Tax=Butyrivibrio sp. WCD3002 TaxID=1280676 RepID=UPI000424AED6|nr:fibronectin type III domain-containing protein [Butyrivibrio sp. WCD3002]